MVEFIDTEGQVLLLLVKILLFFITQQTWMLNKFFNKCMYTENYPQVVDGKGLSHQVG